MFAVDAIVGNDVRSLKHAAQCQWGFPALLVSRLWVLQTFFWPRKPGHPPPLTSPIPLRPDTVRTLIR